jgi:hypothetical protein
MSIPNDHFRSSKHEARATASPAAQLKLFDKLDQRIRRRLRMCYWKRRRYPRMRSRELMSSGVSRRRQSVTGRDARAPGIQQRPLAAVLEDEQGAAEAVTGEPEMPPGVTCLFVCTSQRGVNCLVRTRMPDGVERAVRNSRPHQILPATSRDSHR